MCSRRTISLMRQPTDNSHDPRSGVSIAALAREYAPGFHVEPHSHGSDQLVYASHGAMKVLSGQRLWIVPPHFGLWVPARTAHEIRTTEPVSMRTLYLRPGLARLRSACTVLYIRPLLRELIIEIVHTGRLRRADAIESALCKLLVAELRRASPVPTGVALPLDSRARAVAEIFIVDPGLRLALPAVCGGAGISVRTLERVFRREVGMDFESWRRQARLMRAIEMLIAGCRVKEAALSVGYRQPGALVSLFRCTFGMTPKAWISRFAHGVSRVPGLMSAVG
jgi:AraC-like DNA-binding protein